MTSDSPSGLANLLAADSSVDSKAQPSSVDLTKSADERRSGVSGLVLNEPSNRLIYLDEEMMRQIGLRLLNDPNGFVKLSERAENDHVKLEAVNDARALDAVYFARRIWYIPNNETLMDIPPLRPAASPGELYPGAVVRARAFLKVKEDLRPGRLTLTRGNERIYVEMSNRGVLSINRSFLCERVLYVVGQLRRLKPLSVEAAAILLAQQRTAKNR